MAAIADNPYWRIQPGGSGLRITCLHPRPIHRLIRQISLKWADQTVETIPISTVSAGAKHYRKRGIFHLRTERQDQPIELGATLDLASEMDALQRLRPKPGKFQDWLQSRRQRKRRWQCLALAASSDDPALEPDAVYGTEFLPLLTRLALHDAVSDPALAVLMGFSEEGRQLHAWIHTVMAAGAAQLPVLQLSGGGEGLSQERLLGLRLLSRQEPTATALDAQPQAGAIPIVQYWQGEPIPGDVEHLMGEWPQRLPELEPRRLNAAGALQWIRRHGDADDIGRFERCWHPAMQSDFMRVMVVAREGGLYVDGDTPAPREPGDVERWRTLLHHCRANRTAALCINEVVRAGDIRHYATNCCIWASAGHPFLQRWLDNYRRALDTLPDHLLGTPSGIHRLGPELVMELVDQLLHDPRARLLPVDWEGQRLPRLEIDDWRLLLISRRAYRQLFGRPMSVRVSYQGCQDPRDWKVGLH